MTTGMMATVALVATWGRFFLAAGLLVATASDIYGQAPERLVIPAISFVGEGGGEVGEVLGLARTTRRVVFGIEVKDDRLAFQFGQFDERTIVGWKLEIRSLSALIEHGKMCLSFVAFAPALAVE